VNDYCDNDDDANADMHIVSLTYCIAWGRPQDRRSTSALHRLQRSPWQTNPTKDCLCPDIQQNTYNG